MNKPATPTHAALENLEYENGILLWGGRKVTDIVEEVGRTPLYIYDKNRMTQRVAELREAFPDTLSLHYAMKANPMPEVVAHMVGLVDGLDVASAGELGVALETRVNAHDVSFAGPGKQDCELEAAVRAGITINLESEGEIRRVAAICDRIGNPANVAIRVNPSFELKTAGMKMGGRPSQFGIDSERVPAAMAESASHGLHFRGFHIYSGAQNLRPEAISECIVKTTDLAIELAESTDLPLEFVNIGGGLGIPYFPKEEPLSLEKVAPAVEYAVDRIGGALGEAEVIMELGRYLVGEAGIYVCRVIDVKESRGHKFAVCDGGMHHHLAASGNFGQVLRKNYPVTSVDASKEPEETTVVGPLCTPLDLLGDRVTINQTEVSDLIAVLQSGAYGATASPARFLSHRECVEVFC
jgi:diaminopimelate decarboxylase